MEFFIKKIWQGKIDEKVHEELIKFGKGNFPNKYLIQAKKQKDKWHIKTSNEYANYLVEKCLKTLKQNEKINIKGIIVTTLDIEKEIDLEIKDVKKFMGIKKIIINTEVDKDKLINLIEENPRVFFALSFKTPTCELKIKEKSPKSSKPSNKGEKKPKPGFCSLKTSDKEIVKDLLFDVPNFQETSINHTIVIDKIIYPENLKELKPKEIREKAKRKGKIIREADVDGKQEIREKEFIA
jgi:hypothetical protein